VGRRKVTDRQLEYTLVLAEEGSITSAAERLHISQPSLSAFLTSLEDDLGIKLFTRNAPMKPTYAGEYFIAAARESASLRKSLMSRLNDIKNEKEGRFSLGCGQNLTAYLLPLFLPDFIKEYPNCQINLIEADVSSFENKLESGEMDLALTSGLIDNPRIENILLFDMEVILLAPKNYHFKSRGRDKSHSYPLVDLAELNDIPFVVFKPGRNFRKIADRIFEENHIRPKIFLETNNSETCYNMVAKGLACTFLSKSYKNLMPESNSIRIFSIKGNYIRPLSICYKKKMYRTKMIHRFIEIAREKSPELEQKI
jgi:DNA-binding transcriptional LysR family regulator